jgi:hypothetical protein
MTTSHPKAYTFEEIDGIWYWFDKNGYKEYGGDSKEIAESTALYYKGLDEFYDWQGIAGHLSDEVFARGARKFYKEIRSSQASQNWLRDELLMRLILKNS